MLPYFSWVIIKRKHVFLTLNKLRMRIKFCFEFFTWVYIMNITKACIDYVSIVNCSDCYH